MASGRDQQWIARIPFHYGWLIVAMGCLSIFSCLGLARFAFGVILPGMSTSLGLDYGQMGFLGTANFMGYLVSVIATPRTLRKLQPRLTVFVGLLLISVTLACLSLVSSYWQLLVFYSLTGVGSGFANIAVMVLASHWFQRSERGKAAGIIVLGNGLGMIVSGQLIPALNRVWGADGWRISWLLLAAIIAIAAILALFILRNDPGPLGLRAYGKGDATGGQTAPVSGGTKRSAQRALLILGGLYFAFGATYMIYGTFIVSSMISDYGFSEVLAGSYWSWVGFFTMFSGIVFGTLSDRIGRKGGLMVVFAIQTCAYLLCSSGWGTAALLLSVVLYGITASSIPAIMAAAVGDYLGPAKAAAGFSFVTLFFAAGQTLGPALAGSVAEQVGSFVPAFLIAAGLTTIALFYCLWLRKPVND